MDFKVGDRVKIKELEKSVNYLQSFSGIYTVTKILTPTILEINKVTAVRVEWVEKVENRHLEFTSGDTIETKYGPWVVSDEFTDFTKSKNSSLYCYCSKPELVVSAAAGESFKYCRTCKKENK